MMWLNVNQKNSVRLRDKAFKIASDPKYDGCHRGLSSMAYKSFDKKSSGSDVAASLANKSATKPNTRIYRFSSGLHITRLLLGYEEFRAKHSVWKAF